MNAVLRAVGGGQIQPWLRSLGRIVDGVVKKFMDQKGFGFITPEGGGKDVFFHQSEIQMDGFRSLTEGQRVEFEMHEGPKGFFAKAVTPA